MPLVSKTFSEIITFTRATAGTYFDATGTLQTATSGTPRFDYNPATLAPRGFLVEEQRTNLFLQSAFASGWSFTNSSFTATTTAPDGTNTGQLLNDSSGASAGYTYQGVNVTNGTVYAFSCYVKPSGRTSVYFQSFTQAGGVTFDLIGAGTANVPTGTFSSSKIEALSNGWYRCSVLFTATATAANNMGFSTNDGAFTGDAFYLWGAQVEAGAFPTSYIPTTTATVTRNADQASVNTLSPWFNASAGTLFNEVMLYALPPTSTFPAYSDINDGTANNRIGLSSNQFANNRVTAKSAGATLIDLNAGGSISVNVASKWALAYANGDYAGSANGGAVVTSTTSGLPIGLTQMNIGRAASANFSNGWIRRIVYYPRRLANAELVTLTT